MRFLAALLAASLAATGCGTTSYQVPGSEIRRLALIPSEQRGANVRVIQQLNDADVGPVQPVGNETPIVVVPNFYVDAEGHRHYHDGGSGLNIANHGGGGGGGGHHGGSGGGGGGGGDGKATAIALLVAAGVILVAAAAVEGSRYDGYAQLHPMHPIYLYGVDGTLTAMPLAWLDPQTAMMTDHAIVRSSEGPWRELGRAPLSRQGLTYALFGGLGTYASADGSIARGTATTIQFGYFFDQHVGLVASQFFGWRDNAVRQTLFESRSMLELQLYVAHAGPLHVGLYGGGGGAYRWEDGISGGNAGSGAIDGGALVQLDINTRLAITGRFGQSYGHGERMSDATFGLSIY